jgi:hypothetical protein
LRSVLAVAPEKAICSLMHRCSAASFSVEPSSANVRIYLITHINAYQHSNSPFPCSTHPRTRIHLRARKPAQHDQLLHHHDAGQVPAVRDAAHDLDHGRRGSYAAAGHRPRCRSPVRVSHSHLAGLWRRQPGAADQDARVRAPRLWRRQPAAGAQRLRHGVRGSAGRCRWCRWCWWCCRRAAGGCAAGDGEPRWLVDFRELLGK